MQKPLQPTEKRAITAEALKRFVPKAAVQQVVSSRDDERQHAFMRALNEKQLVVALDPSKRKLVLTGRRFGKTTLLIFLAMRAAREYPGTTIPYIGISRAQGERNFWRPLKRYNAQYKLGLEFNETKLIATAPNGAQIIVVGARDEDEIEKLRGDAFPLVMIDESASFPAHIEMLVEEVIDAALGDYDGSLIMVGTPGRTPSGFFWEASQGVREGWVVYTGTVLDNPKFPRWHGKTNWVELANAYLADKAKQFGGEDSPRYQREQLGRYVADDESQLVRFSRSRNTFTTLPEEHKWLYLLGIDFGYTDETAFVVFAAAPTSREAYIVESFARSGMVADDIAAKVRELDTKYSFVKKVGDYASRQLVADLNKRHLLALQPAIKTDKPGAIETLSNDFLGGYLKIQAEDVLCDELVRLVWNAERTAPQAGRKDHRFDALLYVSRAAQPWVGKEATVKSDGPKPNAAVIEMNAYVERLEQRAEAERNGSSYWDEGESHG